MSHPALHNGLSMVPNLLFSSSQLRLSLPLTFAHAHLFQNHHRCAALIALPSFCKHTSAAPTSTLSHNVVGHALEIYNSLLILSRIVVAFAIHLVVLVCLAYVRGVEHRLVASTA